MLAPDGPTATRVSATATVPSRMQRVYALWARCPRPTLWQWIAWVFGALCSFALLRMSLDSGITFDEGVHVRYGEEILAWFKSGFADQRALFCDQRVYGGLFDLLGAVLNALHILPLDTIRVVHVLSALCGLCAIWATWKTGALIAGPAAGFLAASFLALTPSFVGHSLFNPKDIPFATGAALTLYASVCILVERTVLSWRSAMRAGLCVGVGLAMRPGGLFLLAYPLAAALASRWVALGELRRAQRTADALPTSSSFLLRLTAGFVLAWLVMIAAWPWALQDAFTRPFEAARIAAHYPWWNEVLFNGQRLFSFELPWTYLPAWFAITTPEIYLVALVCAGVCSYRLLQKRSYDLRKALAVALIAASIVVPLLGVFVTRPIIYDAHRHFLFFYPALAALAGLACARVLVDASVPKLVRGAVAVTLSALAALCAFDMHALHPYEYVYFNRAFGGLPAANGRFETDYWSAAHREAFLWIFDNVQSDGTTVAVGSCSADWQLDLIKPHAPKAERFVLAEREEDARIYLATTRDDCHAKQSGRVIHTVARQGVPLVYVFQR